MPDISDGGSTTPSGSSTPGKPDKSEGPQGSRPRRRRRRGRRKSQKKLENQLGQTPPGQTSTGQTPPGQTSPVQTSRDQSGTGDASSHEASTKPDAGPTDEQQFSGKKQQSRRRRRGPGTRTGPANTGARAGKKSGRFAHTYAALDLGTNNCRLLVARPQNEGFKIIDAFSRTVRLGAGLNAGGEGPAALTDEAMDRAIDALKVCSDKIRRRGVTRARCIATEACRTAINGASFIERVKKETDLDLEIITPQKEASLAVSGCSPLLDTRCDAAMVFDIGGGSTELVWLDLKPMREGKADPEIIAWTSLPFGVVTLAETSFGELPQSREEELVLFEKMVSRVRTEISIFTEADHQRDIYDTSRAHLIGNSGTVTTLAAVHLGLPSYDRRKVDGLWIDGQSLFDLVSDLAGMGLEARADIPSVGTDRADLLFPGCAILRAIQETWPSDRVRVADRGLREGILVELMEEAEREGKRKKRPRRGRRGGNRKQDRGGDPAPSGNLKTNDTQALNAQKSSDTKDKV